MKRGSICGFDGLFGFHGLVSQRGLIGFSMRLMGWWGSVDTIGYTEEMGWMG